MAGKSMGKSRGLDPGSPHAMGSSEIRSALATFRQLVERSTDVIALVTLGGELVFLNRAGRDLLGVSETADLSILSVASIVEGTDLSAFRNDVQLGTVAKDWRWRGRVVLRLPGSGDRVPVEVNAFPLGDGGDVNGCLLAAICRNITLQVKLEAALDLRNRELDAINKVLQTTVTCETEKEIVEAFLTVAEDLTGSAIGFVAELNAAGTLDSLTVSPRGRAACSALLSGADGAIRDLQIRGFWGRAFKEGKLIIVNDPGSDADSLGVPAWHAPINFFLGVPFRREDRVCGLVCLANKEGGYRPEDGLAVDRLARVFVEAFDRKRGQRTALTDSKRGAEALRALTGRLLVVREEERTRIAREVHDLLAQDLTRLKIDLVWLLGRLAKTGSVPSAVQARVGEMAQAADAAIHCVQRIATELRPAVLDALGLSATVEWQARDFQDHAGIVCHATVPQRELSLDRNSATATFRVLQECLTNVQRHANATRVDILLREEAGQLLLRVRDDGAGIEPAMLASPLSVGLTGMRERAALVGGQLDIRSLPGSGTTIELRLPLATTENSKKARA